MNIHPIVKILLMIFSGFILSFSAPGYDLWFIAWVGLSPLFIIINTTSKKRELVLYSFLFGFSYNLWYLHWLFSLHPLDWLGFSYFQSFLISFIALVIVAGYNSLFFILFALSSKYLKLTNVSLFNKPIPNLLLITFFWLIIFNKLSSLKILLGFPWTLIEYSQYKIVFLIQIAEYLGSTSISFLIVFFNLVLAEMLLWLINIEKIGNRYIPKELWKLNYIVSGFSFILVLISLSLISGVFLYGKNEQLFSNRSQTVSIIQGNLPIKATRGAHLDVNLARKTYDGLISKINTPLIVLPEGALPLVFQSDLTTKNWLTSLSKSKKSNIIAGSYCGISNNLTNCGVFSNASNKDFSFYEKERLVPFGEFTPFSFLLPDFLKTFAKNIIGDGFKEGKENHPIKVSFGKVEVNICFELIFPTIIRKHTIEGANLIINLSDLSWFSSDRIKQQFLGFAVFRAIENRKPIILATNNGISAFIDPTGKIKSQSLPNVQGVLLDWVNPNNKRTFYSKYGW